jgi:uncharacterized protein (TIGR00251 family)
VTPVPTGKAWRIAPTGLLLAVRVTPKGGRDAIEGVMTLADGSCALKMRVRAAPSAGEANAAMIALLARALGVPPRSVDLVAGASGRIKRVRIAGAAQALAARLEDLCAALPGA